MLGQFSAHQSSKTLCYLKGNEKETFLFDILLNLHHLILAFLLSMCVVFILSGRLCFFSACTDWCIFIPSVAWIGNHFFVWFGKITTMEGTKVYVPIVLIYSKIEHISLLFRREKTQRECLMRRIEKINVIDWQSTLWLIRGTKGSCLFCFILYFFKPL